MNAVAIIRSFGATPRLDESGHLALDLSQVPQPLRAEVVDLARQHKTAIINELRGGPTGSPALSPDQWECPTRYARHREYWISDYGLKICSICHPGPNKGGASWRQ
ncbi:MAG: hypothetical protein EOM37_12520 [Proteobacteria bacterium]|nr:hypothetical protein [Pseudomonadota bacterium]